MNPPGWRPSTHCNNACGSTEKKVRCASANGASDSAGQRNQEGPVLMICHSSNFRRLTGGGSAARDDAKRKSASAAPAC